MIHRRRSRGEDPVVGARAVVAWYGDPTISWSVLLRARLAAPAEPDAVSARLDRLVERYPHLGTPPRVAVASATRWPQVGRAFADEPYLPGAPLVRAAVAADDGLLLVAAHHGVTDGLGLLAILAAALGTDLTSSAGGIADRAPAAPFVASAARRLAEALFTPPARIAPSAAAADRSAAGDVLAAADLPALPVSTAALTAAAARAARAWNASRGAPYRRAVAGLGVSRREGFRATPVAASSYLRLRLPEDASADAVRGLIAAQPPEPDLPPSRSVLPPAIGRVLASRLGSTFLASNLGVVRTDGTVRALAFHPVASGRSGVAVGAATVGSTTTVTVRARRRDFDQDAAERLLAMVVSRLGGG